MTSWACSDMSSTGIITSNEIPPKKREKGFMTSLKRLLRRQQRVVDGTTQRMSPISFFSKISGSSGLFTAHPVDASYHGQGHHEATPGCKAPPRASSSLPLIFSTGASPTNPSLLYCASPLQPSTGRRMPQANSSSSMLLQLPSLDIGASSLSSGAMTDRLVVNGLPQQLPSPAFQDLRSESRFRHAMSSNDMIPPFYYHQNHQPQASQPAAKVAMRSSSSLPLPFIRLGAPRGAEKIMVSSTSAAAVGATAATVATDSTATDFPLSPPSAISMCSPSSAVATATIMSANASATSSASSNSSTGASTDTDAAAAEAPPALMARAAVHASSFTACIKSMATASPSSTRTATAAAAAEVKPEAAVIRATTAAPPKALPPLAAARSPPSTPPTSTVNSNPCRTTSSGSSSSSTLLALCPAAPDSMRRPLWRLSDYVIAGRLYKGDVSSVYKAVCRLSGYKVVLKVYSLPRVADNVLHILIREVRIHTELEHENILALYGVFEEEDRLVLVLERAMRGDLFHLHRSLPYCRMNEDQLRVLVLVPLLDALSYLHSKGVCHRDIKPENLLLTTNWQLRVADFGAAINLLHERAVTRTGTMDYMAPEVERCPLKTLPQDNKDDPELAYSTAADVWSVGVLSYEMLVGFPPFINHQHHNNNYSSSDVCGNGGGAGGSGTGGGAWRTSPRELSFPHFLSAGGRDFISCALAERPGDRPTAVQLLRHPWLKYAVRQHQARKNNSSNTGNGNGGQ